MTPTSPLAGLLTGLLDGLLIATVVFIVVLLTGRRQRTAPVRHPVAADLPDKTTTPVGELPKAFTPHE